MTFINQNYSLGNIKIITDPFILSKLIDLQVSVNDQKALFLGKF